MTAIQFGIVFLTSLAGMIGAPFWGSVVGVCALAVVLLSEDRKEPVEGREALRWEAAQTASSLVISVVAGQSAFLAGRGAALVWGI